METADLLKRVTAKTRWRVYARKLVQLYFKKMWSHRPRAFSDTDPEEVHQMRVAARRLRAALHDTRKCYTKTSFRRWDAQVNALIQALGAVRDLDVLIQFFSVYRENLPPRQRAAIQALISHCRTQRHKKHQQLCRLLRRLDRQQFSTRFVQFFAQSG